MKKQATQYIINISILIIGITLAFWINGWRASRHDGTQKLEAYRSLKSELQRAKGLIKGLKARTAASSGEISVLLRHEPLEDPQQMQLFSSILSQFSNDLDGTLNNFITLTRSNSRWIMANDSLAQYSAFLIHIAEDHAKINSSIHEMADQQLWPILDQHGITVDMNDHQNGAQEFFLKGNYRTLADDKEIRNILRHIRYKKNEQIGIYDFLMAHIDKIIHELDKHIQ